MPLTLSEARQKELMCYLNENGEEATIRHYKLSQETWNRYKREFNKQPKTPKVLLFDIETAPNRGVFWRTGKQYIPHEFITHPWYVIGWAAKWLFAADVKNDIVTPNESREQDDKRVLQSIWELLNDADVIIAHNGDRFDLPRLNTRFLLNKMHPPSPVQTIDTLKVVNKQKVGFAFSSNRLDYLGMLIRRKGKLETNLTLWLKCMAGEQDSLDYMAEYNKEDLILLEDVYLELRPWIKGHPNMGVYIEAEDYGVCPTCGSMDLEKCGHYATSANKYTAFRCNNCKAIGRSRHTELNDVMRKNLLTNTAR